MKTNKMRSVLLTVLTLVLAASMCLSLAACGGKGTLEPVASAAVDAPVKVEPSATPAATPSPEPSVVPSSIPKASPTPTTTPAPSAKAPTVTKNPTSEYIMEGGKALFVAKATNYKSISWRIVSGDGQYACAAKDAPLHFPGVTVWGDTGETLVLSNTPLSLNGWYAQAIFTGAGGTVYTSGALISVHRQEYQVSASPAGGTFDESVSVALLGQSGAQLYYNVQYASGYSYDGYVYAGQSINIGTVHSGTNYVTLSFYAVSNPSNSARCTFTLRDDTIYLNAPSADPAGGYFPEGGYVALYADPGALIYYTLDGSDPHRGILYNGSLYIDRSCTLMVVANSGNSYSDVASYDFNVAPKPTTVSAPTASPDGYGQYYDDIWVNLYADPGATIYYTLDGTDPQFAGNVYQGSVYIPYSFGSDITLRAKANLNGTWSYDSYFNYYFGEKVYYDPNDTAGRNTMNDFGWDDDTWDWHDSSIG